MKLPLRWLQKYVDFNVSVDKFIELMMWRGFEIAEVIDEMPGITNVVVCKITQICQHENADRLRICTVDVGNGKSLQIITAAPNVYEGALVPVALKGAKLAGGLEIHATKMRGVESYGMFCSGKELNLTDVDYQGAGEDKVLEFLEDHPLGQSIQDAVGLNSVIFDIELTPNRADCQSIIGICREAAAALGQKFTEPIPKHIIGDKKTSDYVSVSVQNTELCPRYTARVITDLIIEPSPAWMQKCLVSVGLRPINNIVDITNYVLIEYGHPMHAFDLSCINNGKIVVRNAHENEKIITLDGKERLVSTDMLLIADPTKGIGLAGIMGGANSEITENTRTVLFESAVFKSSNIRSTSRKLHHVTDAAQRFMRGVEPINAYLALERAIELVVELKAGKVIGDIEDVCAADITQRHIKVDCTHVNRIIESDFTPEYMANLLTTINIDTTVDSSTLNIAVPYFRTDIESGIESPNDIAEEVARLHGYDKLSPVLMYGDTFSGKLTPEFVDDDTIHDLCASMGAFEMYNYNFMAPANLDALRLEKNDDKRRAVRIMNPFGEDQSLMRTTLIPAMLNSLALNIKRKTGHGRFFEVGNVHFDEQGKLPTEHKMLGLAYMGTNEDFFTLKGTLEQIFENMGINARFVVGGGNYLCPGKKAQILVDGEVIGELGAIHPDTAKSFEVGQDVYIAEINMPNMLKHKNSSRKYKQIPKFPVVERDIAVVVDDNVSSYDISSAILACHTDLIIENARLFDVYKGVGIPTGQKSMAFKFTLRRDDRTLTDADIANAVGRVIKKLERDLNAKLRG